ncbi:hypothetical protein [Spiroplasma poulsonii]|nr:hypothetical protein [Spiroplasma poulsonii]
MDENIRLIFILVKVLILVRLIVIVILRIEDILIKTLDFQITCW